MTAVLYSIERRSQTQIIMRAKWEHIQQLEGRIIRFVKYKYKCVLNYIERLKSDNLLLLFENETTDIEYAVSMRNDSGL